MRSNHFFSLAYLSPDLLLFAFMNPNPISLSLEYFVLLEKGKKFKIYIFFIMFSSIVKNIKKNQI